MPVSTHAPPTRTSRCGLLLRAGLPLVLLTFLAYAGIQRHAFTHYDDWTYITENPNVLGGLSREGFIWAFTTGHTANWHPLTWLSHQLDVELFGLWPGGHHLVSVALHAVNAVLLFLVLSAWWPALGCRGSACGDLLHERGPRERGPYRTEEGKPKTFGAPPTSDLRPPPALFPPFLIAALFALHPAHVESVAWASERKDLLCALFWILAMGAYARYCRLQGGAAGSDNLQFSIFNRQSTPWYLITLLCLALSLLSKPMAVTLPFVFLLMDWWPLRRFAPQEAHRQNVNVLTMRLLLEKLPFFALVALSCVITLRVQAAGGAVASTDFLSWSARITNAVVAYAGYLRMLVLPIDLAVFYPLPVNGYPLWKPLGACLLLTLISWLTVRQARARPALLFGWLWFLGTLVPVIGLVKVGMQAMADRYTYIPYIGLFIMVAAVGLQTADCRLSIVGKHDRRPPIFTIYFSFFTLLLLCAFLTHRQLGHWRNSVSLADQALRATGENEVAHVIAGNYWAEQGDLTNAITHYQEAVRLGADSALYIYNLGALYERAGRIPLARTLYARALELEPDYENAHLNLGRLHHTEGALEPAMRHYQEVLRINPSNPMAHHNLSVALASIGDLAGAIAAEERALQLVPHYEKARTHLDQLHQQVRASAAPTMAPPSDPL